MKKAITILASLLLFASCEVITTADRDAISKTPRIITCYPRVDGVDFEGHRYIVVYSSEGCGIIHAENCQCKGGLKK